MVQSMKTVLHDICCSEDDNNRNTKNDIISEFVDMPHSCVFVTSTPYREAKMTSRDRLGADSSGRMQNCDRQATTSTCSELLSLGELHHQIIDKLASRSDDGVQQQKLGRNALEWLHGLEFDEYNRRVDASGYDKWCYTQVDLHDKVSK